jgi:2-polyprenyl-3-methyl-5-hydroxy-6-metoxy-1,4-benzoquinol methylase
MGEIQRLSPKSVLDLGCGFGKYGVLCREILDARFGRCRPEQWEASIVGVEVHKAYINPAWMLYDAIWSREFLGRDDQDDYRGWDLVLLIDALEHLDPRDGRRSLAFLVGVNKHLIVSVPNGVMEQGETFGNPYEAHRWTFNGVEEFKNYNFKLIHQSVCTVVSIEGNG